MFHLIKKKKSAPDWLESFLKRHPDLSIRQPESTSLARATGFNKVQVDRIFQLLRKIISDCNIAPDKIFNMDETGISTVQKSSKIVAQKSEVSRKNFKCRKRKDSYCCMLCKLY